MKIEPSEHSENIAAVEKMLKRAEKLEELVAPMRCGHPLCCMRASFEWGDGIGAVTCGWCRDKRAASRPRKEGDE
jgi:hypothetical protein